jgi:hypothetical protein
MIKNNNVKLIYILNISLCFFLLVYGLICGISGNDFFWHVKTGEWIVENAKIPTTDVFSWYASANNYTWYAHEWLSDVLYFIIFRFIGAKGITIFSIFCISLNHLLLMKLTEDKWSKHTNVAFLWFFYHITISSLILQCRPFIFSFIFLNIELYLLYKFKENKNYKGIYFIPLLAILWCNMHGGSSNLSYIVFFIFLLIGSVDDFEFYKLKNKKFENCQIKKLLIVGILTILGNCVNPYLFEMLMYPYRYMLVSSFDRQMIGEWQPLDLKTDAGHIIVVALVAIALVLILTELKIKAIDLVLFGAFTYLLLQSVRFIYLFFIVATYIIFKYMPEKINFFVKDKIIKYICIFASGFIILFSLTFILISKNYTYIEKQLSDDVIEIIKESDNERLLNFYNYGEELIFNEIPVFVDSRADAYSLNGNVLRHAFALYRLNSVYIEEETNQMDVDYYFDELYNFDSVLIPSTAPLNAYLEKRSDFNKVYFKNDIIYWEREKEALN